jgi:hypothetical protein
MPARRSRRFTKSLLTGSSIKPSKPESDKEGEAAQSSRVAETSKVEVAREATRRDCMSMTSPVTGIEHVRRSISQQIQNDGMRPLTKT